MTLHHPVYATRMARDNVEIREAWAPHFDRYGVDLVLSGHDHNYARSGKVFGHVSVPNGQRGAIYVVSISGPKMYEIDKSHSEVYRMLAEDAQLYQIIRVDQDELRYESKTCVAALHDSFRLIKQEDGTTLLLEETEGTREDLRQMAFGG